MAEGEAIQSRRCPANVAQLQELMPGLAPQLTRGARLYIIGIMLLLVVSYYMYQTMLGRSEKGDFTLLAVGAVVAMFFIF